MLDSFSALPLPPASSPYLITANPALIKAKNGGDQADFRDVLAQSTQDVESINTPTTFIAASAEDDSQEATLDAETTKPDVAADIATNMAANIAADVAADFEALLAMMSGDKALAVVLPATLPPDPATGLPASPTIALHRVASPNLPALSTAAPADGDGSHGAEKNAAPEVEIANAQSTVARVNVVAMSTTATTATTAATATMLTTAPPVSRLEAIATKPVGRASNLNDGAEDSAEPRSISPGTSADAINTVPTASASSKSNDDAEGWTKRRAGTADAATNAVKTALAAEVLSTFDNAREPALTTVQDVTTEMPTVVSPTVAGTISLHNTPTVALGAIASLVPTHLDSPAWSKDFGQHVIRLAIAGQPTAEIHLNPPDLGPIKVLIDMRGAETTLQFSAEHATTRDALEASLPRLREIFAAGGINLAHADVDDQPQPQSQRQSEAGFSQNPSGGQHSSLDWALAMKDAARQGMKGVNGIDGGTLGIDGITVADALQVRVRAPISQHSQVDLFA